MRRTILIADLTPRLRAMVIRTLYVNDATGAVERSPEPPYVMAAEVCRWTSRDECLRHYRQHSERGATLVDGRIRVPSSVVFQGWRNVDEYEFQS